MLHFPRPTTTNRHSEPLTAARNPRAKHPLMNELSAFAESGFAGGFLIAIRNDGGFWPIPERAA
jgi:hypothetical protein